MHLKYRGMEALNDFPVVTELVAVGARVCQSWLHTQACVSLRLQLCTVWIPSWRMEKRGKGQAKGSPIRSSLRLNQSGWSWGVGVSHLGASSALCLANGMLLGYEGQGSSQQF